VASAKTSQDIPTESQLAESQAKCPHKPELLSSLVNKPEGGIPLPCRSERGVRTCSDWQMYSGENVSRRG